MILPVDIKQLFFETLNGDKSVLEFENWLYADNRLENIINSGDYLELISIEYKSLAAKYELNKVLERLTDKYEYEKWRLYTLLARALQRDNGLPEILMTFYDLYYKGYLFLDNLGLGYGLAVEVPYSQADSWDELTKEQQQNLLASFYPQIEVEIKKVIAWLDNNKIVLTGQRDEHNHFIYTDNRSEQEKKPTAYKIA